MESGAAGAADGTNPPIRTREGLPHLQLRDDKHARGPRTEKLFERISEIEKDLDPKRTGKVFNVLGEVFPANQLEKMLRDMYSHNQMTEELIKQRIVEQVDPGRFRSITNSTLEGLAKRELNLSAIVGKSAEARERRLVPEVIEQFFLEAAPVTGLEVSEQGRVNIPIECRACREISGQPASVLNLDSESSAANTSSSCSTKKS